MGMIKVNGHDCKDEPEKYQDRFALSVINIPDTISKVFLSLSCGIEAKKSMKRLKSMK